MEGSARDVYNCTNSVDNAYGGGTYGTCVNEIPESSEQGRNVDTNTNTNTNTNTDTSTGGNTNTSTNSNTYSGITTATGTETNTSTDALGSFMANPIVTVGSILILLIFIVWLVKVLVFLIARKRSKRNETS